VELGLTRSDLQKIGRLSGIQKLWYLDIAFINDCSVQCWNLAVDVRMVVAVTSLFCGKRLCLRSAGDAVHQ